MMPIVTLEKTLESLKIIALKSFQILSQVEFVEEASVELIKGAINQLVVENQVNLGLWTNILRIKCSFQRGIMLPKFSNKWHNKL